jgi:hypothetical protein
MESIASMTSELKSPRIMPHFERRLGAKWAVVWGEPLTVEILLLSSHLFDTRYGFTP